MTAEVQVLPDPDSAYKEELEAADAAAAQVKVEFLHSLTVLAQAARHADRKAGAWWDTAELDELADALLSLRTIRQAVQGTEAAVESHVARAMSRNKVEAGLFRLDRRGGRRWVCDNQRGILSGIVEGALEATGGEVTDPLELVWTVLDRLEQVGSITWRVGREKGLPVLGLDPDDYGHREDARRTVQVTQIAPSEVQPDA